MARRGVGKQKTNGDPIDAAIRDKNYDLVDRLLQEKPDRKALCNSLIEEAVRYGNAPLASVLLKHGADAEGDHLHRAFFTMMGFGTIESSGYEAIVSLLLKHGVDPECKWTEDGHVDGKQEHIRPLHQVGVVRALLDAGASALVPVEIDELIPITFSNEEEKEEIYFKKTHYIAESALDLAAKGGHVEVIKELTRREPSIVNRSTAERTGYSALHYAAKHGHVGSIDALVEAGANLEAKRRTGDTALHAAIAARNCKGTLLTLLRHGANADPRNYDGITPLYRAVAAGNRVAANILASAGADVNSTLVAFSSPSSLERPEDICRHIYTLLGCGSDVNTKRASDGNTPLHVAAENMSESIVKVLLEAGGDETAVNDQGKTPADIVGPRTMHDYSSLGRISTLLANAPRDRSDRAWSRRGFVVLCRAFPGRVRLGLVPPENRNTEEGAPASTASRNPTADQPIPPTTTVKGGIEEGRPAGAKKKGATEFSAAMGRLTGLQEDGIFRNIVEFL